MFQPHRYTRTQFLLSQFASCFADADRFWLTEVYAASEAKIPGVDGATLADAVRKQGQPVEFIPALEQIPGAVRAAMQPGDVILFLGAGDITKAAHALAAELSQESPGQKERDFTELAGRLSPKSVLRRDELGNKLCESVSMLNLLRGSWRRSRRAQRRLRPFYWPSTCLSRMAAFEGGDLPGRCSIHSAGCLKIV